MKLAVMQPYFFPYLGYFQLASAVDEFVFYDDVNFKKKGFINRNAFLLNGKRFEFSIPVEKVSQNRTICNHRYVGTFDKFLKQLRFAYQHTENFEDVYALVENLCLDPKNNVAKKNAQSVLAVYEYLGLALHHSFSSEFNIDETVRGQQRIIEICRLKGAKTYINAIGGREIYDRNVFRAEGINLKFLRPTLNIYQQGNNGGVVGLSIIDVLMHCSKPQAIKYITTKELA